MRSPRVGRASLICFQLPLRRWSYGCGYSRIENSEWNSHRRFASRSNCSGSVTFKLVQPNPLTKTWSEYRCVNQNDRKSLNYGPHCWPRVATQTWIQRWILKNNSPGDSKSLWWQRPMFARSSVCSEHLSVSQSPLSVGLAGAEFGSPRRILASVELKRRSMKSLGTTMMLAECTLWGNRDRFWKN